MTDRSPPLVAPSNFNVCDDKVSMIMLKLTTRSLSLWTCVSSNPIHPPPASSLAHIRMRTRTHLSMTALLLPKRLLIP